MSVDCNAEKEPEIMTLKLTENSADSGFEASSASTNKGDSSYIIIPFEPLILIDGDEKKVEVVLQSSAFGEINGRICNHSTIDGPENRNNDITEGKHIRYIV